jgi:MerR family copper efflux transcriptional regulator
MEHLTRGRVAREGGVNIETIRYYERRGLLPKASRLASGYRAFQPEAVRRIRFIKHAQALGFSLKEIKELLALRATPRACRADVRARAAEKIGEIEEKLRALRAMKRALEKLVTECTAGAGSATDCPILEALDTEER